MALPIQPNTTCDIYRAGTAPPAAPAVAGVACFLQPDWRGGQEHGDRGTQLVWTHLLLVDAGVDIRDAYTGAMTRVNQDAVYIPDKNGTAFTVAFIERVHRNLAERSEERRVGKECRSRWWPEH